MSAVAFANAGVRAAAPVRDYSFLTSCAYCIIVFCYCAKPRLDARSCLKVFVVKIIAGFSNNRALLENKAIFVAFFLNAALC